MSGLLGTIFSQGDRAKRYITGLLSEPVATFEQVAGQLQDNHRRMQGLLDRAPTDPEARAQATDMALSGLLGFAPVGMAKLVKPLGSGPHYAVDSLDEYTPLLYRETSADRAVDFLPNSQSQPQTLWFSNEPAYALGQGVNRGVLMEFDAKNIPGQLSLSKPMARHAYESGNAEFVTRDAMPADIGANLQSIRVTKDQQKGPYFRRIQGLLKDWAQMREPDGSIVFKRQ